MATDWYNNSDDDVISDWFGSSSAATGDEDKWSRFDSLDFFTLVVPAIHLSVGICGNGLVAYVMYEATESVGPFCCYAILLAVVDFGLLIFDVSVEWLTRIFHADLHADVIGRSDTTCKTFHFLRHFLLHLSSWIVVSIAVEIVRLAKSDRKLVADVVRRRVVDTVVVLVVLLSTLNVHYFWTYGLSAVQFKISTISRQETKPVCKFVAKDLQGYYEHESCEHVLRQLHYAIADVIPIAVVLCVLALLRRIRSSEAVVRRRCPHAWPQSGVLDNGTGRHRRGRQGRRAGSDGVGSRSDSVQVLVRRSYWLLLVIFVVIKLPYVITRQVGDVILLVRGRDHFEVGSRWPLCLAALKAYSHTNYSYKVFVYLATWGRFRQSLRQMFTFRRHRLLRSAGTRRKNEEDKKQMEISEI